MNANANPLLGINNQQSIQAKRFINANPVLG